MFYFIHVIAGAVVTKFFSSIPLVIILSLISHFILDIIPHRDNLFERRLSKNSYNIKITKKAVLFEALDAFIGLILIIVIYLKFSSLLMLFSIFISLSPDVIKLSHFILKDNKFFIRYLYFHSIIQTEISWTSGIIVQVIITIILLKILF